MTAISVSERLLEMAAFYTPLALTVTAELKKLAHLQKMWALRKPILDAHILSLREKAQKLEQEVDWIVMEKVLKQK